MATPASLSPAQRRFLAACEAAGEAGHASPASSGRESVAAISAWHRTATSLERRGLIRTKHNGSRWWAWRENGGE